jgi:hypothetical protein
VAVDAATGASTVGVVVAVMLMGSAAVWAISLGFYAIGRAEDRQREADARDRPPSTRSPDR